ncbi:Ldh family oxidoreductase [Oceanobacillus bengalensis]|uniref:Ldh family oxidoreductase n=1 Tax=Oceanobacillus bengalensis TaxID=1435466 RepID=A0A494YZV3_9BACI|nr:Ldh family oxidoreductase [Oceanobacillus bengalensis]RKQ15533.1 Ldh family oxidoreductase [Oceanobacillus bengalensis]
MVEIEIEKLNKLMTDILLSNGVSEEEAPVVVDSILEAERSGVESHGVLRLKPYVQRIKDGLVNANPDIKIAVDRDSIIVVDGDNGLGQVVAEKTLEICYDRLEKSSIMVASVRNSNHFGTSGYFSRKAAEKGYLAMIASNASPTMAPWGGLDPLLGTNPIAMSFPIVENSNFTLDMATSATAKGKIRTFERKGIDMPTGYALDKDGYDTTDPKAALDGGTILPLGQHKGYGLSMFVDVLCAGLSAASLSYETDSMFNSNNIANIGHFFLLIKIDDIVQREQFDNRMQEWINTIKSSETRPGFEEIYIPGEIENNKLSNQEETIFIHEKTYKELLDMSNGISVK